MLNRKKREETGAISTASMPDIIFMLLIFFMVSTVMREFRGLPVQLPEAKTTKKIEGNRNFAHLFVDRSERISLDDKLLRPSDLTLIANLKRQQNPRIVMMLKIDQDAKYGFVDKVHKALQDADARRVTYAAKTK
ncbi:MAG: biopolymer transporter ExbD [Candidatus Cloacimonadota bacterium]|nr:MAG: biopolymer transporter ExbD [Candidatus Cloacimonadota bacterium]PIE78207.1 MAG: biopolymer transporter ExbD [Candidatus Delongbacteria bacterium]